MKTIKNRSVLIFAMAFVVAFSLFAAAAVIAGSGKAYAESPFEGDEVAFSTTKIQFDVTPDTYDFFTFEYKFDTDDQANNLLSVYLMDGNSSKYFGYYYFKQDGTFYQGSSHNAGVATTAVDGWIKVVFTVAELEDRKGDATGANKPADLKRFYAKASSGTGLVRNASFYFAPSDTIEMVEGASVRSTAPYGIRFRADLGAGIATDADATFGMTIIPYDYLTTYSALIEAANGDYIAALDNAGTAYRKFNCTPVKDGDDYYVQASLTDIKAENLEREFIGIAWYEKAGEKTYAFNPDCARSIKDVSLKALIAEDGDAPYGEEQRNFLLSTMAHYDGSFDCNVPIEGNTIEFYVKRTTAGSVRFALIEDDWQAYLGYFEISETNVSNDRGVLVETVNEDWIKVRINPSMTEHTVGDPDMTAVKTVYFKGGSATFEIIDVKTRSSSDWPRGQAITAGSSLEIHAGTEKAYTKVSFDYIATTTGEFAVTIMSQDWSGRYGPKSGYYMLDMNSAGTAFSGATCTLLEDGYIHVEITIADAPAYNDQAPDGVEMVYIRGNWTSANGFIDNVQFIE
ncbi:MAG: hypothetical protein J5762_06325 [Clostridia bacterium]|nr:hypothetical protein [Clostridia bacterium]